MELGVSFPNGMGNDQFVDFPLWLLAAGFGDTCNPSNASLPIWLSRLELGLKAITDLDE